MYQYGTYKPNIRYFFRTIHTALGFGAKNNKKTLHKNCSKKLEFFIVAGTLNGLTFTFLILNYFISELYKFHKKKLL